MGYAKTNKYYKPKPIFFIVKIQLAYQFTPDWYREGEVRESVLHYYWVLRQVLRDNPHLRKCLTRCKHCGIFFLTHPRNAGRRDLSCPFGCRQVYQKENLKKRSAKYYRSEKGKKKKKELNERRDRQVKPDNEGADLANESLQKQNELPLQHEEIVQNEEEVIRDKGSLCYIQMVISLIEGCLVSLDEVLKMLAKIWRQHSIDRRRRFVYAFTYPSQRPP